MATYTWRATSGATSLGCPSSATRGRTGSSATVENTVSPTVSSNPRCALRATAPCSPAPIACATTGSSPVNTPIPKIATARNSRFPSATAAIASAETRPTTSVSTTPIAIHPTCTTTVGAAMRAIAASAPRNPRGGRDCSDMGGNYEAGLEDGTWQARSAPATCRLTTTNAESALASAASVVNRQRSVRRHHPHGRAAVAQRRMDTIRHVPLDRDGEREGEIHWTIDRSGLEPRVVPLGDAEAHRSILRFRIESGTIPARPRQLHRERAILHPGRHVAAHGAQGDRPVDRTQLHRSRHLLDRQRTVLGRERQVGVTRNVDVEGARPRLAAPGFRTAGRDGPAPPLDTDRVYDRLRVALGAGLPLDPCHAGDRIAIPSIDRDAAVLTRIDAQRTSGGTESGLAHHAHPGTIVPAPPAVAALRQPFLRVLLGGERGGGGQEQHGTEGGACRHGSPRS